MEKILITILYLTLSSIILIVCTLSISPISALDSTMGKKLEKNDSPVIIVPKIIRAMEGENVVLDGSKSYDIEGDPLSFFWKQLLPANFMVVLSDSRAAIPSFAAPTVKKDTTFLFQLILKDDHGNTENEKVAVILTNNRDKDKSPQYAAQNTKHHIGINKRNDNLAHNTDVVVTAGSSKDNDHSLIVRAGEDLEVISGKMVSLKAKVISQDSSDIKIIWSQIRGAKIQLSSKSVLNPIFIAPDVDKPQLVQLRIQVIDDLNSASDTISIKIDPKQEQGTAEESSTTPKSSKKSSTTVSASQTTTSSTSSDRTPPTVVSTNPANGARGIPISTLVKATFSEPIPSSSLTSSTFTVRDSTTSGYLAGARSVSSSDGGRTVIFAPSSKLSPSTTYIATLTTGVKDLAGNAMISMKKWYFVTTSATSSNNVYDDFGGGTYTLPEGSTSPNGKWVDKWNGYGQAGVKSINGNNVFYEIPKTSIQSGETHSSLVVSSQKFSDFTLDLDMNTYKQLRQNSPPNTWETAWVFWRVVDLYHSYYFVLKTNGIEFGKKDTNCNCEEQVFLKTASTPKVQIGSWSHIKISSIGKHTTIWVDGSKVVDMDDPSYNSAKMSSGFIGLYNEDASVGFDNVRIGPP